MHSIRVRKLVWLQLRGNKSKIEKSMWKWKKEKFQNRIHKVVRKQRLPPRKKKVITNRMENIISSMKKSTLNDYYVVTKEQALKLNSLLGNLVCARL